MTKTIDITELCLRDAHQSLLATRLTLDDKTFDVKVELADEDGFLR